MPPPVPARVKLGRRIAGKPISVASFFASSSEVARPDFAMKPEAPEKSAELGKRLYANKYGCNACHAVNQEGGKVGPALDRAGFRLNPSWVYRWIKYPQAMKSESRMPNLGISDQDAKAISLYLSTLRAPRQEAAADKPAS